MTRTDYIKYCERVEQSRCEKIARTKQVRKQKIILVSLMFFTIIILSVLSIKLVVFANSNDNTAERKQYKSVMIYCGDSLSSIANQYTPASVDEALYEKEICSINNISSSTELIPGNYLIIPCYIN